MARSRPLLSEAQWKKIAPLLSKARKHRKGGRPWIDNRRVLEGILWILRSGARWQDLPEKYPHPSCWRRLRDWEEQGIWLNIWRDFLSELNEREELDWSESFLDGSFAPSSGCTLKSRWCKLDTGRNMNLIQPHAFQIPLSWWLVPDKH